MRNYNFRRKAQKKERLKRKQCYGYGYFPTTPNRAIDPNGNEYFLEGCQSKTKPYIKKISNRKIRKLSNEEVPMGQRRRVHRYYDFYWNWF